MIDLHEVYTFSAPRYFALRAMVLAAFDPENDAWPDVFKSEAVCDALKPFCGRRNSAYRSIAIAFEKLLPYASEITCVAHLEYLFPVEFAASLHEPRELLSRIPSLSDLSVALNAALLLWTLGGDLTSWKEARRYVIAAKTNYEATTRSTSGTTFGRARYLLDASEAYITRTEKMVESEDSLQGSLEEALLISTHQCADNSDSEKERMEAASESVSVVAKKRARFMSLAEVSAQGCRVESSTREDALSIGLVNLQKFYPTLSTMAAALQEFSMIDASALAYFSATFAIRMYIWDNCRRRCPYWDIPLKSRDGGLTYDLRRRRMGVPYRLLNKTSIWLFWICETSRAQASSSTSALFIIIMNTIVFRSWWNSREFFSAGVCAFAASGGNCVLDGDAKPIAFLFDATFAWDLFREAAGKARERSGAYNAGTFGCRKGVDIMDAWVVKLRDIITPAVLRSLPFFNTCFSSEPADRQTSQSTVAFFQCLLGKFVGYQVTLDVGYFYPFLFNHRICVYVGPGALAVLRRIFSHAPWPATGMVRSTSWARASVPFVTELQGALGSHPSAEILRRCCSDLGLQLPCVNDVEYHCCEMRQLEHERIYAGMGLAPDWYIVGLQHDSVRSVLGFELISSSSSSRP